MNPHVHTISIFVYRWPILSYLYHPSLPSAQLVPVLFKQIVNNLSFNLDVVIFKKLPSDSNE